MNTTTDTAAPYTPNAVYSVPSLSIHYLIEFNSDRTQARLLDGEHVTEWLPIVTSTEWGAEGQPEEARFIDPDGYLIELSSIEGFFHCSVCNEDKTHPAGSCTTGYGVNRDTGAKTCFACIGIQDREELERMKPGDKTYLFLSGDKVTNWPGTFSAPIHGMRVSCHNFGIKRRDFWFWVNYKEFHGYQIGEFTQVAHIRRTNRVWNPILHKFTKETVSPATAAKV